MSAINVKVIIKAERTSRLSIAARFKAAEGTESWRRAVVDLTSIVLLCHGGKVDVFVRTLRPWCDDNSHASRGR